MASIETTSGGLKGEQVERIASGLAELNTLEAGLTETLPNHLSTAAEGVAATLSLDEMERRVSLAVAILRGEAPNTKLLIKQFDLQVAEIDLEIRATYLWPAGVSRREILGLVELANPRNHPDRDEERDGVAYPQSTLLQDPRLDIRATEDTRHTVIIYKDSKITYKDSRGIHREEQIKHLEQKGAKFADCSDATVAAALFRDKMGWPLRREAIGTESDPGDLFQGMYVRTDNGVLKTDNCGLHGDLWLLCIPGRSLIVVSGSPKQ